MSSLYTCCESTCLLFCVLVAYSIRAVFILNDYYLFSNFLFVFHTFWPCFFPSTTPFRSSPPPLLPTFMFFISLFLYKIQTKERKKIKTKRKWIMKKWINKTKWNKRRQKQNMESFLCLPTTPGQGACSGVWLIDRSQWHLEKMIFPFASSMADSFLVSGGSFISASESWDLISSGLNMCRSCAYCQSLWVHMCVSQICLEASVYSESSNTFDLHLSTSSSA